jgi:hypothetical protein
VRLPKQERELLRQWRRETRLVKLQRWTLGLPLRWLCHDLAATVAAGRARMVSRPARLKPWQRIVNTMRRGSVRHEAAHLLKSPIPLRSHLALWWQPIRVKLQRKFLLSFLSLLLMAARLSLGMRKR